MQFMLKFGYRFRIKQGLSDFSILIAFINAALCKKQYYNLEPVYQQIITITMHLDAALSNLRLESSKVSENSQISKPNPSYIKNPYYRQYKNFQQRLRNPKIKSRSLVMRKRKNQLQNKQNLLKEQKQAYKEECFQEARKLTQEQNNCLTLFPVHRTIDYQLQQCTKQSQLISKLKSRIQGLRKIDNQSTFEGPMNKDFKIRTRLNTRQITTGDTQSILSERNVALSTASSKVTKVSLRMSQPPSRSRKVPLSFISYKKDKTLAEKFTTEKLSKRLR